MPANWPGSWTPPSRRCTARRRAWPTPGCSFAPESAAYSRVRRARNAGDHRGEDKPQSADDVRADLPDCRRIVDIAANTLPHLTPFA